MVETEKKIIKLIKFWITPTVIESLILIIILMLIPKDPKNAWLFGYSKSRILVLVSVLIYIRTLLYIRALLSPPPQKISELLQKLITHPSTNYFIEIIYGLCILLLFSCSYYLYNLITTNQTLEPIHIRIIPIIIFIVVLFTQIIVFLILFRLILEGEKFALRKIMQYGSFPLTREKIFINFETIITRVANNLHKSFLTVIFVFTPAILTLILILIIFNTTPLSYIPNGSDQIDYWHETLTFIDYGFSGGQYSFYEKAALAEFSGFGVHGPAIPVLYGLLGRIIGWEFYSGVLINFIVITLALFLFTQLGNLDNKQLVTGIILVGTYWPLLLYLPINMTESLNLAIAMVVSVLFFKQLVSKENNWKINITIFLILLVSITIRITWSLLFFPFFLFLIFNYKSYKLWGAFFFSTAGILLSFLYSKFLYAPPPFVFRYILDGKFINQNLFYSIRIQLLANLKNLIYELDTALFIQAFRYQILGVSIFIIFKLISYFKNEDHQIKSLFRSELSFHFLNIVVPFSAVVILYHVVDVRDYRNLIANFLLSALVLLLFSRYKYIYVMVLINVLLVFSFIPGFAKQRSSNFIYDEELIKSFSNSISEHISFDETQNNRWCNTLGFQGEHTQFLLAVDSGIGLSRIEGISEDTKSRYILLSEEYVTEFQEHIKSLGLKQLEKTILGILFINPNNNCE